MVNVYLKATGIVNASTIIQFSTEYNDSSSRRLLLLLFLMCFDDDRGY